MWRASNESLHRSLQRLQLVYDNLYLCTSARVVADGVLAAACPLAVRIQLQGKGEI